MLPPTMVLLFIYFLEPQLLADCETPVFHWKCGCAVSSISFPTWRGFLSPPQRRSLHWGRETAARKTLLLGLVVVVCWGKNNLLLRC